MEQEMVLQIWYIWSYAVKSSYIKHLSGLVWCSSKALRSDYDTQCVGRHFIVILSDKLQYNTMIPYNVIILAGVVMQYTDRLQ